MDYLRNPSRLKMKLVDLMRRRMPPEPWAEGEKIPWNDAAFSRRMLAIHLDQNSDWASRRAVVIDDHINWIEKHFLSKSSSVLDLGCGPGLYTERLAARGHHCVGIDFSPASVAHARETAERRGADIDYRLEDVRTAHFGTDFDLVMMLFGEFNLFRREEAIDLLGRSFDALRPGGYILVEGHLNREAKRQGEMLPFWQSSEKGLFSEEPHLLLEEHSWEETTQASTTRYWIVDAKSGEVTRYASTMQSYTEAGYGKLFSEAGFDTICRYTDMGEKETLFKNKLVVYSARRPINLYSDGT
jgi:SAM-dependent methyltransferase